MEQILSTLALIAAGLFSVWILVTDPGGDDVHGNVDPAFLGALFLLPIIILLLAGIVLLIPVVIGAAAVLLLAFAAFALVRWFLTRERKEKKNDGTWQERFATVSKHTAHGVRMVMDSRPVRSGKETLKRTIIRTKQVVSERAGKTQLYVRERVAELRRTAPGRIRERVRALRTRAPGRIREAMCSVKPAVARAVRRTKERVSRGVSHVSEGTRHVRRERNRDAVRDAVEQSSSERATTSQRRSTRKKIKGFSLHERVTIRGKNGRSVVPSAMREETATAGAPIEQSKRTASIAAVSSSASKSIHARNEVSASDKPTRKVGKDPMVALRHIGWSTRGKLRGIRRRGT